MSMESPQTKSSSYWYEQPGKVDHLYYGVFEGGGAKGIAYVGALKAMRDKKCWFRAVAGASAGAITAALIAAGASPEQLETETDNAFAKLKTGIWSGVRRLQKETGYFASDGLCDWLNGLLQKQVEIKTGVKQEGAVTFEQLFDATGIELNIVAADLSMRCQVIFCYSETPECSVADAVTASSSIPFAFPSRLLQVREDNEESAPIYHHTIVDGGVWSNFPMYLFDDDAFREAYSREPTRIEPERILGFILDEADAEKAPEGRAVKFVRTLPAGESSSAEKWKLTDFSAREWKQRESSTPGKPRLATYIGTGLLAPFYGLSRLTDWNSGIERGRWPQPRSRPLRYLLSSVDGLLGGIHTPLFGFLTLVLVTIGAWNIARYMVNDQVTVFPATDWTHPMSYVLRFVGVVVTLLILAVAILLPFVTLLGVVANHILLRTSRRILYGLVTTYVAGSGAPAWVGRKRNVVSLPIPRGVTTLSFEMDPALRKELIEGAERETLRKLQDVLAHQATNSREAAP